MTSVTEKSPLLISRHSSRRSLYSTNGDHYIDLHSPNSTSVKRYCYQPSIGNDIESEYKITYQGNNAPNEKDLLALLESNNATHDTNTRQIEWIINISLYINIFLFVFKLWAWFVSRSLSIAASTTDSFLDLCVQLVIVLSHGQTRSTHDRAKFPVGKSRFEPVGLVLCAALMFLAGIQLISSSIVSLYQGEVSDGIDFTTVIVIFSVIVTKSILWFYCEAKKELSESVETLAFDHRNDALSNIVALVAIFFCNISPKFWWGDAIGCIIISIYIACNWYELAMEKIHELVGVRADGDFVSKLEYMVNNYHPDSLELDSIRAYHFGIKYLVEVDVIFPEDMTVREAHDIGLKLQQAIEQLEPVERCFVHADYVHRDIDEHDPKAVAQEQLKQIRQQQISSSKSLNTTVAVDDLSTTLKTTPYQHDLV